MTLCSQPLCAEDGSGARWQPIDSAPMDGTPVLLLARCKFATAPVRVIGWGYDGQWAEMTFCGNMPVGLEPTHWMPLPDAPQSPRATINSAAPTGPVTRPHRPGLAGEAL